MLHFFNSYAGKCARLLIVHVIEVDLTLLKCDMELTE
jgi:hypothetical protein